MICIPGVCDNNLKLYLKYPFIFVSIRLHANAARLTDFMQQNPSWEANTASDNQENSPHFMAPGCPLPDSQEFATCSLTSTRPIHFMLPIPLTDDLF